MIDFLVALALIFVIEGVIYTLFPDAMKRMMAQVIPLPSSLLRSVGLAAVGLGVVAIWLIRL
jgi:uncharacterized protein YjeT (DUF2065 family)